MAKSTKSYEERMLEMEKKEQESLEKAKRYAAQKKELLKRKKAEESKKRTHRLCQVGGAVESVLGAPIEEEDIPKLIGFLKKQEANGKFFSKAMQKETNTDMEYNEADDYRHIRVTEKHPYSLEKGDSYERETKVFYQVVTATCESIVEVWKAYQNALEGSGENILNEIPSERDDLPQFVYDRFPVIKDFPIPFGTDLDDIPLEASVADRKDELQLIVQEPFTRNFIRSRVANSFMFLIGTPIHSNRDGVMTYGGRLNVSMINWHKFGKGKGMIMEPGDIAHWVSPTISGYYMHAPSSSYTIKNWNVKAGANYNMDIFVSPKRFLGLYSYFEMGIDRRNDETRFLVAPSVGIQLGSLIGVHNFNMPGWLRIPLGIILPLKFAVTCNKVAGRPVEWISNMEVDILF